LNEELIKQVDAKILKRESTKGVTGEDQNLNKFIWTLSSPHRNKKTGKSAENWKAKKHRRRLLQGSKIDDVNVGEKRLQQTTQMGGKIGEGRATQIRKALRRTATLMGEKREEESQVRRGVATERTIEKWNGSWVPN